MNATRRIAILFLAAGLVSLASPSPAQTPPPTVLRLASAPDDDVTPVLYAQQAGLFRAAGLDVEVRAASSGAAVAAAVVGGAADLGKSSMLSIIAAHARGVPVTIVAPSAYYVKPFLSSAIIVPKDSSVRSARDLDDKVVSVPALNDLLWVGTRAWIDRNGGDSSTVRFVETPMSLVATALDAGRVAAGTLADPALSQDLASGKYRVAGNVLDGIAPRLAYSAWFANLDYVKTNAAAVERFVRVLREASAYANRHHAETVGLLAKFSGLDPAVIARMSRTNYATSVDPRDIQPLIDAAARYKVIPAGFDARELLSRYALVR